MNCMNISLSDDMLMFITLPYKYKRFIFFEKDKITFTKIPLYRINLYGQ